LHKKKLQIKKKETTPSSSLAPCHVLFPWLAARCPHNTERSLARSPARAQPPPGGSCTSTTARPHFPLRGPPDRPRKKPALTVVGEVRPASIRTERTCPRRVQTNPKLQSLPEVFFFLAEMVHLKFSFRR